MFRPGYLNGLEVTTFKDRLGISIKGMDVFLRAGKPIEERKVPLQLAEGLAACLMGYVKRTACEQQPNGARLVLAELDAAAYAGAHTASFTASVAGANICGGNWDDKRIFTELESTSANSNSANTGKTELSTFVSAIAMAIVEYRNGSDEPKPFLADYHRVLTELDNQNCLPLSVRPVGSTSIFSSAVKDALLLAMDSAYEYLAYGGDQNRAGAPGKPLNWDVKYEPRTNLPFYNAIGDFASLFTDTAAMQRLLSVRLLPNEPAAAAATAAAVVSQPAATNAVPNAAPLKNGATKGSAQPKRNPKNLPARPAHAEHVRGLLDSSRIMLPRGGCYSVLFNGPAGTGKTWDVHNSDEMPVNRVGVSSEVDASLLLGEFNRDEDGAWKPFLGSIAKVVRASMLEAILICFKRNKTASPAFFRQFAHPLAKVLNYLQMDPADADARQQLEEQASPMAAAAWRVIHETYFEIGAPSIGPVRRLFLDEIWDSGGNKEVTTVLKFMMEDERRVILSRAGAGWQDLFAYNVHVVAAGNPDEALGSGRGLSRAVRSRFGFTYGVDYPKQTIEADRVMAGSLQRTKPVTKPASLDLVKSVYEPAPIPVVIPTRATAEAAVQFAKWTREEFKKGALGDLLDPRGVDQITFNSAYIAQTFDVSPKDAFKEAVSGVIGRLCEMDDLGLPLPKQRDTVLDKAKDVSASL